MSDVDKVQIAEEAAAQRAQEAAEKTRQKGVDRLRREPYRATATKQRAPRLLPIEQIHPGDNIRLDLPEIQELARSIREVGLLTPLLVRPWDTDAEADGKLPAGVDPELEHFRLVAGHRRHAALLALVDADIRHFETAACEIREGLSEAEAYALMLTENVQRVALEPVQAARALRLLLDLNSELDAATLAKSLGLKPAWAQTHLKLLDLPQEVIDRIEAGDLSVTIADLLRRGESAGRIDKGRMIDIAEKIATGEITTAQAKQEVAPPKNTQAPRTVTMGPDGKAIDPRDLEANGSWSASAPMQDASGAAIMRPATPLSGSNESGEAGVLMARSNGPVDMTKAPQSIPYEDRLDAYLLGRALREWATDDYLDNLGIDRVQCEAYALALGFEERIQAIRRISSMLMDAEASLVGSR
ncbi:MAG: ParB domain protein nuclease [Thermoleophilia bacterium]|jgi:ParB/RepB/Spo0J family partition protein|nr:ParB domain protein nuclease [Thermoleophilia bacterium]